MPSFDLQLWKTPPATWSQCPFWFWNDTLTEAEILRQIADFQAHGIDAFVIHPRMGLPHSIGWLDPQMLHFMRVAIDEAKRRGMWVMLYDEGMYPSGSSCGQVVARDPSYGVHGLVAEPADAPSSDIPGRRLIATVKRHNGEALNIWFQPVEAVIRGLHFVDEVKGWEDEPPAGDLLNPDAVRCFIELVYDRYHEAFGEHFGTTISAIFTDEPNPLGRLKTQGAQPGNPATLEFINRHLGYDFTPHLPALWFDDEPDAAKHRRNYADAIAARLNETWYRPLYDWCARHGVMLAGHPAEPDDIGHLRYFQLPGQDIVWRHVEPAKPSAIEGAPATMAKAAASAAFHHGRSRNLNEFAGAYGENLTFAELRWLASWLLIRGCNLLLPHAFYYSIRGPRKLERPPDVGPNNTWWHDYRPWADFTRRLCWLNGTTTPVCEVAILGRATSLPWVAAKACHENQIDFHYLEPADLPAATVTDGCLHVGPGRYRVIIVEPGYDTNLPPGTPRLDWSDKALDLLKKQITPVITLDSPAPALRARHLRTEGGDHIFTLFNEGEEPIQRRVTLPVKGKPRRLDPHTGALTPSATLDLLQLDAHGWEILYLE